MQGLFESVQNEICMSCSANAPADDAPREDIDDEGDINEAVPGLYIREVRDPKLVRRACVELAIDKIKRADICLVADRGALRLAADYAAQAHLPHQAGDRTPGNIEAFALQLAPHLADPIDPVVLFEHAPNGRAKSLVVACSV